MSEGRRADRAFNQAIVGRPVQELPTGWKASSSSAAAKAGEVQKPPPDEIKRILDAWEKKEYFKLLNLPEPTADELGRPVWSCTSDDVSKAFRKLSILVHPDKIPGEDARKSFEALNQTQRMLKDPDQLYELLRNAAPRLRAQKERSEARSTVEQRIQLNAVKNARARDTRKEEGSGLNDVIVQQMKRRQEEARWKAEAAARARATALQGSEAGGAAGSEDEDDEVERPRLLKKRKKPAYM